MYDERGQSRKFTGLCQFCLHYSSYLADLGRTSPKHYCALWIARICWLSKDELACECNHMPVGSPIQPNCCWRKSNTPTHPSTNTYTQCNTGGSRCNLSKPRSWVKLGRNIYEVTMQTARSSMASTDGKVTHTCGSQKNLAQGRRFPQWFCWNQQFR